MKRIVFSVMAIGGVLLAVACSSAASDVCNKPSPCANDTPLTQAQKDQCTTNIKANESSACYNEGISYVTCVQNNVACGGDQKTDQKATATQVENNCKNQLADFRACCTKNTSATACKQ